MRSSHKARVAQFDFTSFFGERALAQLSIGYPYIFRAMRIRSGGGQFANYESRKEQH